MARSIMFSVIAVVGLTILAPRSSAGILTFLNDEFDDFSIVGSVQEAKAVEEFRLKMNEFRNRLYLKERNIQAFFGTSTSRPAGIFAMPVAQARVLLISGLMSSNPKNHVEFYTVGTCAGIEVWYGGDGVSAQTVLFYLRVDDRFPKLTAANLEKRLDWENKRWRELVAFFEKRMDRLFTWEVDREAEKKFYEGDYARDTNTKLANWLISCDKLGYRLRKDPHHGRIDYYWYRPDGSEARYATGRTDYPKAGDQYLQDFYWYGNKGRQEVSRRETGYSWTWCRPDGTTIREEHGSPNSWTWYDKNAKEVRLEWDDYGDGIPDFFSSGKDGKEQILDLEKSWAVHPELIPQDCRIPDQPDRLVPLRKRLAQAVVPVAGPKLPDEQLRKLWDDLAGADGRLAYQAIERLVAVPQQSVPFLASQENAYPKIDAVHVGALINDLNSDVFGVREKATKALEKLQWHAGPSLNKALENPPTLEVRVRLTNLLERAEALHRAHLRRYSLSVKVLALTDTPEAHRLLNQWASRAPEPSMATEARETLTWLKVKRH